MNLGAWLPALACALAMVAVSATAQEAKPAPADDIASKIVNAPNPEGFRPYGGTTAVIKDKRVQSGRAMRITVAAGKPDQPWSVGLNVPLTKPVKKGDKLVVAFWGRAEKTEGGAPGRIANVSVQLAAAPYTGLFGKPVELTREWAMYNVAGVADRDYPVGMLNAAMHLGGATQVIDLGPMFVLDLGQ